MSVKKDRMTDRILEIMGELLMFHVTDPALHNVSVTRVELDAELEYADVYVSALGDDRREKEIMKGLDRANGFLRREMGSRIRLRRTPHLVFHWDLSLQHVEQIEQTLGKLDRPTAAPDSPISPTPDDSETLTEKDAE